MSTNSMRFTWSSAAIVLLVACSGGSSGGGANPDHAMDATGGAGTPATSGGDGGGTASSGSGGTHSSSGDSGSGGHATSGHGAGGSDAGSASGTGGKASAEHDAGSKPNCPPECLRAYTCAPSCSEPAVNNGCCPCPAGTIDTITCNTSGSCGLPCMGAKPDDAVVTKCQSFTDQASCSAWHGNGFPDHCEWHTPGTPPCMAP